MISFWRNGFGSDASWEVHNAPSGDYRITLRGIGEEWPEWSSYEDEFSMTGMINEIVFFATPYTLGTLDPWVVRALLEIHEAVYPIARHPRADELLRERHHGEYLRELGRDLEAAVKHRLLRVERIERPWPFAEVGEKPPSERPPPPTTEEESFFVRVLDEGGRPMSGAIVRVTGAGIPGIERTADSSGWVEVVVGSVPSSCTVQWRAVGAKEFQYERAVALVLGDDDDSQHRRLGHLGYDAESMDERLAHYKTDFGLEDSATLADVRGELAAWHDGGARPTARSPKEDA